MPYPSITLGDDSLPAYNEDSIRVLKDIEHIRTRSTMYISSDRPTFQMFDEIFSNALDEAINGFADRLVVDIDYESSSLRIEDNGRGLPQGLNKETQTPTVLVIYSKLNSGGKYDQTNYIISGGLNGVGSCVVNALSSRLEVTTWRGASLVEATFSKGELIEYKDNLPSLHNSSSGTSVSYTIDTDHELFETDRISSYEGEIFDRITLVKTLLPELTIIYNSKPVEAVSFDEFVQHSKRMLLENNITVTKKHLSFSMNWSEDTNRLSTKAYCNFIYNPNGGDHERGLCDALTEYFGTSDVLLGLTLAISVMHSGVVYDSQAKLKAISKSLRQHVKEVSLAEIKKYFKSHPTDKEDLLALIKSKRSEINKRNNKGLVKRDRRSTFLNSLGVAGFSDCSVKDRTAAELYVCEGESAAGSLKQSRDIITQAVMPLRGKFINAYTSDTATLLKNAEVATIVSSINVGIFQEVNTANSRYGKVIVCTDADEDGKNIACLLLAFFMKVMPEMIEQGYIYLALPPLYGTTTNNKFIPINTEEEKNKYLAKGAYVQRYKGLGEMSPSQIKVACMDTTTRSLLKIDVSEGCSEALSKIMGGDSKHRKELLIEAGVLV